jgi:hypothetical protein
MVKHKSILDEEHDKHVFHSNFNAIFCLVRFGHAIQHSVISVAGQMNKSMTHQPLKCNTGIQCLHFSSAADGWWK